MRHSGLAAASLLCVSVACLPAVGQKQSASPADTTRNMEVTNIVPTQVDQVSTVIPDQCDADGNVYLRPYGVGYKFGWGDMMKFSPKGEKLATFSPQPELFPTSSFVSKDGTVYVMAVREESDEAAAARRAEKKPWTPPDIYILQYRKDGQFDRKTKLAATFLPSGSFAVFPSGEILVSAIEQSADTTPSSGPFTALFDQSGAMLKKISSSEDDWIIKAVEGHDDKKVISGKGSNPAVATGQTVVGADGNAYIMRRTNPAMVYVISGGGEIVRTLTLSSGDPPLFPSIMAENHGQLAILFQNHGPSESRIKVFDSRSGEELETANVGPMFGSAMTCFNPPNFTFLRVQDKKFVFTAAQLR